mmetsp:Transcript_62901/g.124335  ORF Transcript_62901/g.124335 Transcript_62901/m.124335 type:complete len:569 (+) Transcript_62901:2589-4295(+)
MVGPTIGRAVAAMWSLSGAVERGCSQAHGNDHSDEVIGLEASEAVPSSAELFDGSEAVDWPHLRYNRLTVEVARWELERLLNQARGESGRVSERESGGDGTRAEDLKVPKQRFAAEPVVPQAVDNSEKFTKAISEKDSHEKSNSSPQEVTPCEHVQHEQVEDPGAEVEAGQQRPNTQEVMELTKTMDMSTIGSELQSEHQGTRVKATRHISRPSSAICSGTCRNKQQSLSYLGCQSACTNYQHSMHTSSPSRQRGGQVSTAPMHHASSPLCSHQLRVHGASRDPTRHKSLPLCDITGDFCDVRNLVRVSRLKDALRGRALPGSNHQSRSPARGSRVKICPSLRPEDHRRRAPSDTKYHARAAEPAHTHPLGLCAKPPPATKPPGSTLDAAPVQKSTDAERLVLINNCPKRSHVEDCRAAATAAVAAFSANPSLVVPVIPVRADSVGHKCSADVAKSRKSVRESPAGQLNLHTISPDQKVLKARGICIQSMSETPGIADVDKSCDLATCDMPPMDCSDDSLSSSIDSGTGTIARPVSGVKVSVKQRPRSAPAGVARSQIGSRIELAFPH